jgi:cytochrome o ubiquinol oxidase subunit 2
LSQNISKTKKRFGSALIGFTLFIVLEVALLTALIARVKNFALFNPKGFVAESQMSLMLGTVIIIFAVAIPTVMLLYFYAWKYRESNTKATYDPDMKHGKLFNVTIWALPSVFMLIMAFIMWPAAHRLDPRQAIVSANKPLTIQVIAMQWKWVFIYPEQHIATVNYVQIPTDTPVKFELSADEAPMSSFWIPNLGGQLYAMTGHANLLNLIADQAGEYPGSVAEINGAGFADMKFITKADTQEKFDDWVRGVKNSPKVLDRNEYDRLLKPSENNPAAVYAIAQSNLWDSMRAKYSGSHGHMQMDSMNNMEHK